MQELPLLFFGVPINKVDRKCVGKAKVINFGIIYGMGVSALRKNLGGTREEAQNFTTIISINSQVCGII